MIENVWISLLLLVGVVIYEVYARSKRTGQRLHHIRVKSARGVVTKLVLNDQQYEQFTAFLQQPDGVFEIGDERAKVFLERRYVAAVEVRVK